MASMAATTICLDIFQTLYIVGYFTFEVSFDLEALYELTDSILLIDRKLLWLGAWFDLDLT
jgi:hypothetical protein